MKPHEARFIILFLILIALVVYIGRQTQTSYEVRDGGVYQVMSNDQQER